MTAQPDLRILITGSRHWSDSDAIVDAIREVLHDTHVSVGDVVIVQGGAVGADTLARSWAERNGATSETWRADWSTHGRKAGMLRNQAMVDAGADICLAFPLGPSPGTRDCMRRAEAAGILVVDCG